MGDFRAFMKENKTVKEDESYPVTDSLQDEKGNTLMWKLRHMSSKEFDAINKKCTVRVPVVGKRDQYTETVDSEKLSLEMLCAVIIEPDLRDSELQDSYGVKTPQALILEMVDNPGEYQNFVAHVLEMNGFNKSFDDKVKKAKN